MTEITLVQQDRKFEEFPATFKIRFDVIKTPQPKKAATLLMNLSSIDNVQKYVKILITLNKVEASNHYLGKNKQIYMAPNGPLTRILPKLNPLEHFRPLFTHPRNISERNKNKHTGTLAMILFVSEKKLDNFKIWSCCSKKLNQNLKRKWCFVQNSPK